MRIKALQSFAGTISMTKDETRECEDEYVINDLMSSGYVEVAEDITLSKISPQELSEPQPEKSINAKKKTQKRTVKADENK